MIENRDEDRAPCGPSWPGLLTGCFLPRLPAGLHQPRIVHRVPEHVVAVGIVGPVGAASPVVPGVDGRVRVLDLERSLVRGLEIRPSDAHRMSDGS